MITDTRILIIPDFMIVLRAIHTHKSITVSDLHYETRITYAHIHNLKQVFVRKGWVTITEEGVRKLVSLTEKGESMYEIIQSLLDKMEITDDKIMEYRRRGKIKKDVSDKDDRDRHGASDFAPQVKVSESPWSSIRD